MDRAKGNSIEVETILRDIAISLNINYDEIKIDSGVIEKSNQETIKLFGDKNFQTLLKIYYENPNVFKVFASYVSSGNVMMNSIPEVNKDVNFDREFEEIKNLNLGIKDSLIRNALVKFSGHLNLSLRYLLTTHSVLS